MDADGDYDDSSGFDSPAEERAEYEPVRIPLRDVRAAADPRMSALRGLAGSADSAGAAATSASRAAYGPPPERELTDAEYDEMQRERNRRAVIEREAAMAQVAVPRGAPYADPRGAGASRATTGQAQMTPEQLVRIEALRRHYEGR
jgi:hypothetical protein